MTSNIDARPILFSGLMVRALLDGRKTMTRRLAWKGFEAVGTDRYPLGNGPAEEVQAPKPTPWLKMHRRFEEAGEGYREFLYVRETWAYPTGQRVLYQVTDNATPARWRPSIHMPREHSRIALEVTGTKLERLQDISEEDARAEGVSGWRNADHYEDRHARAFRDLWNSLHDKPGERWGDNPECVALTFQVHHRNIDRDAA